MDSGHTIAAIATPPGTGAIAVVRIGGPRVRELTAKLVRTAQPLQPRVATLADVLDEDGRRIDRGIALLFAAPNSYTGEDLLELQVHGSPAVAREVVRAAIAHGARAALPGEFTRRALLNGKMDLHAVEAVADVMAAQSRSAARAASANLGGGLAREVQRLRAALANVLEELAAAIDFPDEVAAPDPHRLHRELAAIAGELQDLQRTGEFGRIVREGVTAAIVGAPNAGKSSLLNALLREDRALVSEEAGTTRDTIEESLAIGDVMVRLIDTAGIRAHADRLEAAGIERSRRALEGARLAIVVIDASQPPGRSEREVLALTRDRARVVFANKLDLGDAGLAALRDEEHLVVGSVRDPATIVALEREIARAGWGDATPDLERPHLATLRELDAVAQALDGLTFARSALAAGEPADLIAGDLQRAHAALGHVTADAGGEEVLRAIFARFCIGK